MIAAFAVLDFACTLASMRSSFLSVKLQSWSQDLPWQRSIQAASRACVPRRGFGFVAQDGGSGFLNSEGARQNPLVPPANAISRRQLFAGSLYLPSALLFTGTQVSAADKPEGNKQIDKVRFGSGPRALDVPPMGIGAWSWGDESVWGYGGYDKELGDESIKQAFLTSVKSGVTFFDTAEVYGTGRSEELLGGLIEGLPAAERSSVVVASKFYPVDPRSSMPRLSYPGDLIAALDASRRRLRVDTIDLYQIHAPLVSASPEAVADALAEAVESGRCKAVGVSNYGVKELVPIYERLQQRGIPLASNQIEYSLLRQLPETSGLLAACRDMNIGVIAYSPLAMGRLTGKYSAKNKPRGSRFFSNYPMDSIEPLVSALRRIGESHGKTPAQVALNWIICKGAVPIPGAKNAIQAADNAGAVGWRLTGEEVDELTRLGRVGKTSVWQHDGS